MSPRTGRPKTDNPKSTMFRVRLDEQTVSDMQEREEKLNTTCSNVVRKGIELVKAEIEEK